MDVNEWTSHEYSGEEARIQHIHSLLIHSFTSIKRRKSQPRITRCMGLKKMVATNKRLVFRLSGKDFNQEYCTCSWRCSQGVDDFSVSRLTPLPAHKCKYISSTVYLIPQILVWPSYCMTFVSWLITSYCTCQTSSNIRAIIIEMDMACNSCIVIFIPFTAFQVTVVDNYFTGRKRNVEHWYVTVSSWTRACDALVLNSVLTFEFSNVNHTCTVFRELYTRSQSGKFLHASSASVYDCTYISILHCLLMP
jgi:hypothetical protein